MIGTTKAAERESRWQRPHQKCLIRLGAKLAIGHEGTKATTAIAAGIPHGGSTQFPFLPNVTDGVRAETRNDWGLSHGLRDSHTLIFES